MTCFENKVRHANKKNSFINNEPTKGISVQIVKDEFLKVVIITSKDDLNKTFRLATKVAAEFQRGYDVKALKKRVREVARMNGLKVRPNPEAITAERREAAKEREFREILRGPQDEVMSKVTMIFVNWLSGVRFKAGWQKEKCLEMCLRETLEMRARFGDKILKDNGLLLDIYTDCIRAVGGTEVNNY